MIGNPGPEAAAFRLVAEEIQPRDERELEAMRGTLRCGAAQFSDVPLTRLGLTRGRLPRAEEPDPDDDRDYLPDPRPVFGVLPKTARGVGDEKLAVELGGGETGAAVVTIERQESRRADDLNVVQVTQQGDDGTVIGGIWIVVTG